MKNLYDPDLNGGADSNRSDPSSFRKSVPEVSASL